MVAHSALVINNLIIKHKQRQDNNNLLSRLGFKPTYIYVSNSELSLFVNLLKLKKNIYK